MVFSYQSSERVFARENDECEWVVCYIVNCFYSLGYSDDDGKEWPAYTLMTDTSGSSFSVFEDTNYIRKYIDKPIGHIKQSIEYGDDADFVKYLVNKYKMDIHLIYKDIIETSLLWGNVSVCAYLNTIKTLFNYNDPSRNVYDDQGKQMVHIASLKTDHDFLYVDNLTVIFGGHIPSIFRALDSKNKSILHYLVMVDNIKYLEHFIENELILSQSLHRGGDNRKISILEWEDSAGKTPSQYASLLRRTNILQILQDELSQINLTYFLERLFSHKLDDSKAYDKTTSTYPITTREDIESMYSLYSDIKDGILSPFNKEMFQCILYSSASKGLLAVLQFFIDCFPLNYKECSSFKPFNLVNQMICHYLFNENNNQEKIRKKVGLSNSLLNAAILGDLDNNIYMLYCDLDSDIYDGAYANLSRDGESDGFDYFKTSFDKAFEKYCTDIMYDEDSIINFCGQCLKNFETLERDPKIEIYSTTLSIDLKYMDYYRFDGYFDRLNTNHKILKEVFVHGKVSRMKGSRVQERKETLKFLLEKNDDLRSQHLPKCSTFVELGQVCLLFGECC